MSTSTWADVPLAQWDAWDYLCYLGLESLQKPDIRSKAPSLQRGHPQRSGCVFPLMSREPKLHQLAFVAHYFSLLHSADPRLDVSHFILADQTGLGKTTQMAMVIAYSAWACTPENRTIVEEAGVSASFKPHVLRGFYAESPPEVNPESAAVTPMSKFSTAPVLIVTENGIKNQLHKELLSVFNLESVALRDPGTAKDLMNRHSNYAHKYDKRTSVYIVSWTSLQPEFKVAFKDGAVMKEFKKLTFFDIDYSYVFFDEAHVGNNPETQRFQHGKLLALKAKRVMALTATPAYNHPLELLNIVRLLGRNLDGAPDFPDSKFANDVGHYMNKAAEEYPDCHPDLQLLVSIHLHLESKRRRLQSRAKKLVKASEHLGAGSDLDEWDLVGLLHNDPSADTLREEWLEYTNNVLHELMRPLYTHVRPFFFRRVANATVQGKPLIPRSPIKPIDELVKSHLAVCAEEPRVLPGGFEIASRQAAITESDKIPTMVTMLKTMIDEDRHKPATDKRKYLVYSSFKKDDVFGKVVRQLDEAGIPPAVVNGNIKKAELRTRIFEDFQRDADHPAHNGKKSRILIISSCASSGINLHRASVLILLDQPWSAAGLDQIISRIDRLGQTRETAVVSLLASNTIDCGLCFAQIRKAHFTSVMDENGHHIAPFVEETILHPAPTTTTDPDHKSEATRLNLPTKRRHEDDDDLARKLKRMSTNPSGAFKSPDPHTSL